MLPTVQGANSLSPFANFPSGGLGLGDVVAYTIETYEKFRRGRPRAMSLSGARFATQGSQPGSPVVAKFDSKVSGAGAGSSPLDSLGYQRALAEIIGRRAAFNKQWRASVLNPEAQLTADALTETARPVFQALLELGDWSVDLSGLPAAEVNCVHLAVILRTTLRHKKTTTGWDEALRVCRAAAARMEMDERKVLSGLIKK